MKTINVNIEKLKERVHERKPETVLNEEIVTIAIEEVLRKLNEYRNSIDVQFGIEIRRD